MSDEKDPLLTFESFVFHSEAQRDFMLSKDEAPAPATSDSSDDDIVLHPRPGTNVPPLIVSREGAAALGIPLDPSSELNAEDQEQIALATALMGEQKSGPPPQLRPGTHSSPIVGLTSEKDLINFLNKTRRVTIEKLEEKIVNDSTPLMLWKLREYALQGRYTETRAIEIWLNWAAKIASRPKKAETDPRVLKNGALFDATLTPGQVLEAQAQEVTKKQRSGNFPGAGDHIGKFKAPKKVKPAKARKRTTPKAQEGTK